MLDIRFEVFLDFLTVDKRRYRAEVTRLICETVAPKGIGVAGVAGVPGVPSVPRWLVMGGRLGIGS